VTHATNGSSPVVNMDPPADVDPPADMDPSPKKEIRYYHYNPYSWTNSKVFTKKKN
jgi:hypothetical protein